MSLHGTTTTGATITDGVEAAKHGVFEESMMHVSMLVFLFQDLDSILRRDSTRSFGVVFNDKASKRLTYDQTYIERLARIGPR